MSLQQIHIEMAETHSQIVKTTYSEMIEKKDLAPMLNLDPNGPWEVVSTTESGLVMVHYRDDADLSIFCNLRGIVLDTKTKKIVSQSFPHAETIVASSLEVTDGKLILNENTILDPEKIRLKMGFEGTLVHVFKHGGTVYHSTRKRFDCSRSRWGSSKTFGEIYEELSGPKDEVLFDPSKNYSPYCHTFILAHPDVLICTKDNVSKGYLVYLGAKKMYACDEKNCPYPLDEVDVDLHMPNTTSSFYEHSEKIYCPQSLSLEEANKHLIFGFYEGFEGYQFLDPRLFLGEFVILEDLENEFMYRIESPSYHWRSKMRNNNPNLKHRFFELLDYAYLKNTEEDEAKYKEMFPVLTPYPIEQIQSFLPFTIWPQNPEIHFGVPDTRDTKLYNIWQCFLAAVPISRQAEVFEFLIFLVEKREKVVEWLLKLSKEKSENKELSYRVQDILNKSRMFSQNRIVKKQNFDKKTQTYKTLDMLIEETIRNFISKEKGFSLYRLIREMEKPE